ncbi:MAG: polysaccharide biosynthesis protein [Lachnospiraceae bacterium]|nr:polysaccharide biosynthesis protein [Lachnospiraceae bacterium]
MSVRKATKHILLYRRLFLITYDIVAVVLSGILAILARFDFTMSPVTRSYMDPMWETMFFLVPVMIIVFFCLRLYSSLWEYASVTELQNSVVACFLVTLAQFIGAKLLGLVIPRSCYVFFFMFFTAFTGASRFAYRFFRNLKKKHMNAKIGQNVMIVGAGEAGNNLVREIKNSNYVRMNVKCVVDDDPNKQGRFVQGVKVEGKRENIPELAQKYDIDVIIISIPSAPKTVIRDIINICQETKCRLQTLPGMYQLVNEDVSINSLRDVDVEDLLGREPVRVNTDSIAAYVQGQVVLVTGGGGSIGSELCRQIAAHKPKQLIIVDIYENNAYEIQQELIHEYPHLNLVVLIASVRNTNRINDIFKTYHPDIVYHAAAHKHVPLMEVSPNEAIKNNVFGTLKTARAAGENGCKRFVMISTDKAVNPTNIMGASKRICEMIIQSCNKEYDTEFVAVRFGNVLGSNGSVIPLFKKQIEQGGPVTVTHPDIIRYFMTIPEAVSLVLQAGAYAKGGEIFVLDMGEPVKIYDLACNLIKLSGYTPNEDIMITFTGLRPGEKLYEEMLMEEEGLQDTDNHMIHIGKPIEMDEDEFFEKLADLAKSVNAESDEVRRLVQEIVPTYHPEENVKKD